jgi:hypothetical protein
MGKLHHASIRAASLRKFLSMTIQSKLSVLLCLLTISGGTEAVLAADSGPDWTNLVVVGDSLSAGVQNFSLIDAQDNAKNNPPPTGKSPTGQQNGYASLIANQVGVKLTLPLISYPGLPQELQLLSLSPLNIQPASGPFGWRELASQGQQETNVSVPGVTVHQALYLTPTTDITPETPAVQVFATAVLGYPQPTTPPTSPVTEINVATRLHPTTVIEWLGNNDALVPALIGQLNTLTPIASFAADYKAVLDQLAATHARIITANIPDVTEISYFMTVDEIAAQYARYGITRQEVMSELGIGAQDSVRITGAGIVEQILTGTLTGPLDSPQAQDPNQQTWCPSPQPGLATGKIPCVLTAADALKVRSAVSCYNLIIAAESYLHGALMVDIKSLVDDLYQNGYSVNGETLNLDFLGGITSLDGVHPTNTGYAIIANRFINTINSAWGTRIADVSVSNIESSDPLVFPTLVSSQDPKHALPQPGSCLSTLF